jgi:hypothetical protein
VKPNGLVAAHCPVMPNANIEIGFMEITGMHPGFEM